MVVDRFKPSLIDWKNEFLFALYAQKNPLKAQKIKAKHIIKIALQSTEGKKVFKEGQGLKRLLDMQPYDYSMITNEVDKALKTGNYDWSIFPLKYIFSTSGTTGEPKLIPATQMRDYTTFVESFAFGLYHPNKKILIDAYINGSTFFLPAKLIKSMREIESGNKIPIMNVSAYQSESVPKWLKRKQFLGKEIINIDAGDKRDELIILKSLQNNISHFATASPFTLYKLLNQTINNFDYYVNLMHENKRKKYLQSLIKKDIKIDDIWPKANLLSVYKSLNNLHYLELLVNMFNKSPYIQEAGFNTSDGRLTIPSFFSNELNDNRSVLIPNSNIILGRKVLRNNKNEFLEYENKYLTINELLTSGLEIDISIVTYDLPFPWSLNDIFLTGEPYNGIPTVYYKGRNNVSNLQNAHVNYDDLTLMVEHAKTKTGIKFKTFAVTNLEQRLSDYNLNNKKPRYQILIESDGELNKDEIFKFLIEAEVYLQTQKSSITYHEVRRDQENLGFVCLGIVNHGFLTEYDKENSKGQGKLQKYIDEDLVGKMNISTILVPDELSFLNISRDEIYNKINQINKNAGLFD
jgi:hypothetical protein